MSWCQQVSIRIEQLELRQVEPGDEPGELVGRRGVAAARAPAERHGAPVQLERRGSHGRADDVLEHAAQQRFVAHVAVAGSGIEWRCGDQPAIYGSGARAPSTGGRAMFTIWKRRPPSSATRRLP